MHNKQYDNGRLFMIYPEKETGLKNQNNELRNKIPFPRDQPWQIYVSHEAWLSSANNEVTPHFL